MDAPILWWEKVGDRIEGRTYKKPGGEYRLVKGLKPPYGTLGVFESIVARKENIAKAKEKTELAEKAMMESLPDRDDYKTVFEIDAARIMYSQDTCFYKFKNGELIENTANSLDQGVVDLRQVPARSASCSPTAAGS